jgi:hypothetical protein
MSKYKMKGGEFNEAMETQRERTQETKDETQGKSKIGKTIKTSKSEGKIMKWWDIDKTVGESRFWQIVGIILLIATLYFVIFQLK